MLLAACWAAVCASRARAAAEDAAESRDRARFEANAAAIFARTARGSTPINAGPFAPQWDEDVGQGGPGSADGVHVD